MFHGEKTKLILFHKPWHHDSPKIHDATVHKLWYHGNDAVLGTVIEILTTIWQFGKLSNFVYKMGVKLIGKASRTQKSGQKQYRRSFEEVLG